MEEREARRQAVRLAAAQRRLGDPVDVEPLAPSPSPDAVAAPELANRSARRLLGRLPVAWMRRRGQD